MFKKISHLSLIFILTTVVILGCSTLLMAQTTRSKGSVVFVYASWSVVSRDLKPVAKEVTEALHFTYHEFDIDDPSLQSKLAPFGLSTPSLTPFVAVIKSGKIVFQKGYPNSTPDKLKEDLTDELSKYI